MIFIKLIIIIVIMDIILINSLNPSKIINLINIIFNKIIYYQKYPFIIFIELFQIFFLNRIFNQIKIINIIKIY